MCGVDDQQTPDRPAVPRVIDRLRAAGAAGHCPGLITTEGSG
jgi:hypothetical protein